MDTDILINIDDFTSQDEGDLLLIDASELGIAPGVTPPEEIVLVDKSGQTEPFTLHGRLVRGKEVLGWSYWSGRPDSPNIQILND